MVFVDNRQWHTLEDLTSCGVGPRFVLTGLWDFKVFGLDTRSDCSNTIDIPGGSNLLNYNLFWDGHLHLPLGVGSLLHSGLSGGGNLPPCNWLTLLIFASSINKYGTIGRQPCCSCDVVQNFTYGIDLHQHASLTGGGNLPLNYHLIWDGHFSLPTGVGSLSHSGQTGGGNLPPCNWFTLLIFASFYNRHGTPGRQPYCCDVVQNFTYGIDLHQHAGLTGGGNLPLNYHLIWDEQFSLLPGVGSLSYSGLTGGGTLPPCNWFTLMIFASFFNNHGITGRQPRSSWDVMHNLTYFLDGLFSLLTGVGSLSHSGRTGGGNLPLNFWFMTFLPQFYILIHDTGIVQPCQPDRATTVMDQHQPILGLEKFGDNSFVFFFQPDADWMNHCSHVSWTLPGDSMQILSLGDFALRLNWADQWDNDWNWSLFSFMLFMHNLVQMTTTRFAALGRFSLKSAFGWLTGFGCLLCFTATTFMHRVNHDSCHRIFHCLSARLLDPYQRGTPGPKSRGWLRPKTFSIRIFHLSCVFLLGLHIFLEPTRGEGCTCVMAGAEVSPWTPNQLLHSDTKPHDTRPETSASALTWHPAQTKVVKRSIRRAYARALQHGLAWYRGKCLVPTDFPQALRDAHALTRKPEIREPYPQHMQCNQRHKPAKRFSFMQWNAGGLSIQRLDAIKVWMQNQQIDAAMIVETRWTYEHEWTDGIFHYAHSGDPNHRGAGILCILSTRFCRQDDIRWKVAVPGRLMHIQIRQAQRNIDLVGCYQHTQASSAARLQDRAKWWNHLDALLHELAARNVLVLSGDYNCNLLTAASHSGPSRYRWQGCMSTGAQHQDAGHFMAILRMHGLTALNSWSSCLGPTFVHGSNHSRIDFVITRKQVADGQAKMAVYAWDAPFCSDAQQGHTPILVTLRKQWYMPKQQAMGITPAQRRHGHHAFRTNSVHWQDFLQTTANALQMTMHTAWTSDEQFIPALHATAVQQFHQFFPQTSKPKIDLDEQTTQHVMTKWHHRRQMLSLHTACRMSLFQAWYHLTRFQSLNRLSKILARTVRQTRFQEIIDSAQKAAQHHDTHALFTIINKYSPKQSKRRMQLRNAKGQISSPIEESSQLRRFIMDTWHGPDTFPISSTCFSGMPFTADDLASELARIPATKAVARPCAPGAVWKSLASLIAPVIHEKLSEWWRRPRPFLPSWFRNSWMILIPKPNKPPTNPRALRPLALQEPISKAIVGLLTRAAQHDAFPLLSQMPLWAYLPGRSTQDALARVASHCRAARLLMQSLRTNPFTRQQGLPKLKIAGALQIFLDIERAFDMISREHLFGRLHHLGINPQIIQLLAVWHQETHYTLFCNGEESSIPVGKGVRQGCRAAPLLWNGYMWLFLVELCKEVDSTWVLQCLNVYADDCQMGDLFQSHQALRELLDKINRTLLLLKRFGLTINPTKCTALLTMGGTNHRKIRASITAWRDGKEWLCLGTPEDPLWIPIDTSAKYLGTIISYKNLEDATTRHRVQLARIAFGRLKRWLTGKRGLKRTQRLQLFTTCVYPVLTYGIFSIGITQVGLQHIVQMMYSMLRQILCNHAYITGHSHTHALTANRIALPAEWLWRSAETLQRSIARRNQNAGTQDIVHTIDWTHLADIYDLLQNHGRGPDLVISQPELEVPMLPTFTCQLCGFQTHDTAVFRRHCTIHHGQRMTRTVPVDLAKHMQHGLPQCKFCHQKFTTWRTFTMHAQRGCQVLLAGPPTCWIDPSWPLATDLQRTTMFAPKQDAPIRGQIQLSSTDLQNITSQEWGSRILTIVGTKNWHHMRKEQDACTYLANRCCLCDQFLGRTQELHRHYKLHHPEFWPHVQAKGTQLTHLHGEEPPCPYCGALFKASHQCTVWLQLAMLLIYGGGITSDPHPAPVTLRCEICMDTFATHEELHAHLTTTHRLKSTGYNVARDSLAGEPVCAHCHTMYDSLESLRSHINQSRCAQFNPDLPTEVVEVLPQWIEAMCGGQLANVLRDAHVRLQLTLRCQNCSSRYQRSASLAGHLQTAHPALWSASQDLTQAMVAMLYEQTGCLCNPGVGSGRNSHICLPIRQLAMQHMRMEGQIFFPHQPTDDELTAILSLNLTRQQRFTLERTITERAISDFWTSDSVLTILRNTCVLCGRQMHPADLIPHLYEAHQCGLPIVHFLKTQLVSKFAAHADRDDECYACHQIYNCPRQPDSDTCDASRIATAQAHYRAQCPCVLQGAIILSKAAHGRHGHARDRRCEQPSVGSFPSNRPPDDGQNPDLGAQRTTKAPKKRRFNSPAARPRQTKSSQGQGGSGTCHDADGQAGLETGSRSTATEAGGHLRLLFRAQRAKQQLADPGSSHQDLGGELPSPSAAAASAAAEAAPDADAFQHASDQAHSAGGIRTGFRDPGGCHQESDLAARWTMPVSGMGCHSEADEGQSTSSIDVKTPPSVVHRHDRAPGRCEPGERLPCVTLEQQGGDHVEAPGQLESGPALANPADDVPIGGVAPDGDGAETPWTTPKPPCSELAAGLGHATTEQGQGQREIQGGDQAGVIDPDIQLPDPRALLIQLAQLTMQNPHNLCFANAAVYSFLWTTLTMTPCDLSAWGRQRQMLSAFIQSHQDMPANLGEETWFVDILRCWGITDHTDPTQLAQQDAAEFIHVWLSVLQGTAFNMRWEQRFEQNGTVVLFDQGQSFMPLHLRFDTQLANAMRCDLNQLVSIWRQADGMHTALVEAPPCLCVHVDRCIHGDNGQVTKSECKINLDSLCLMPVFRNQGLAYDHAEYQIIALMSHLGQDGSGHYRAALRISQTLTDAVTPAEWLLTDDWVQPVPAWIAPQWMTRTANLFWLLRTDCIHLLSHVPRLPLRDITMPTTWSQAFEFFFQLNISTISPNTGSRKSGKIPFWNRCHHDTAGWHKPECSSKRSVGKKHTHTHTHATQCWENCPRKQRVVRVHNTNTGALLQCTVQLSAARLLILRHPLGEVGEDSGE